MSASTMRSRLSCSATAAGFDGAADTPNESLTAVPGAEPIASAHRRVSVRNASSLMSK